MNGVFEAGTSTFEIGAVTTITGVVLVFSMLVFLVLVLWIFGAVASIGKKSAEKKANKAKADLARQFSSEPEENTESVAVASEPMTEGISNEVVAAISAAVAVMYSGTGKKPVIKSVKKVGGKRSAWASAGIADNTRSF